MPGMKTGGKWEGSGMEGRREGEREEGGKERRRERERGIKIPYKDEGTNTSGGIWLMKEVMFTKANGVRYEDGRKVGGKEGRGEGGGWEGRKKGRGRG